MQKLQEQSERVSTGHLSPSSSSLSVHSQDGLQREIELLRSEKDRQDNETYILQKSLEELSARLEVQQHAMQAKDETIAQLMGMIKSNKGVESKQLEVHKEQHSTDKKKLGEALNQIAKLREVVDERDRTIASLQEVLLVILMGVYHLNKQLSTVGVTLNDGTCKAIFKKRSWYISTMNQMWAIIKIRRGFSSKWHRGVTL